MDFNQEVLSVLAEVCQDFPEKIKNPKHTKWKVTTIETAVVHLLFGHHLCFLFHFSKKLKPTMSSA